MLGRGLVQTPRHTANVAQQRGRRVVTCAAPLALPANFTKVAPKGDLVLARVAEVEEKTTGGILLPGAAQRRPTSGDVVAVGDGRVGAATRTFQLAPGDTIVYSKFGLGATDLELNGEEHILIREDDVIGIMPRAGATAADVPELRPIADRVLIKVEAAGEVTLGGVILPDAAKDKPVSGTVVRTGPGKVGDDGARVACKVAAGDRVVYFKWAGDAMETPDGDQYVVLHESDILCKQA